MAYCQNCGAEMSANANFCSNCGAGVNGNTAQAQNPNANQTSDTAKTILTAAGTAAGVSLLGNALRRRRRHPMHHFGRPMGPGMHGHRIHGHGMHGPMGGPMGGRGGRGPGRW